MNAARRIGRLACAWVAIAAWGASFAQPKLSAYVEPASGISTDRTIQFVIEIEGGRNPNVDPPRLPLMTNLVVLAGPERRISSSWVNGEFSSMVQLRYNLTAEDPGPAVIPSFSVVVDGQAHRTETIRFAVSGPTTRPAPPPSRPAPSAPEQSETEVFLKAEIGSREVWVGQAVPLSVTLFAGGRISNPGWRGQPSLSSFWVEDLEVDPEGEAYSTTINARRYIGYPLERKVLIPQTQGEFEIEPWVLQLQIRTRGSDPFDIFSLARGQTIVRRTDPLALTVKPLPSDGRPPGFGGAVGTFELTASLDRDEVRVNDAVALRAAIEGEGFLLSVDPPLVEAPAGVKLFDPETSSSSQSRRGKLVSRKSWEWILVPTSPGEIQLGDLEFHYFDPTHGRYETARHSFQPVVVRQSDQPLDETLARGEIQLQRRDLAFIKPLRGPLRQSMRRTHERAFYLALLVLPLAWVPLVVVLGRRRARLQQNRGLARARKAGSRARKRLKSARRHLDGEGFHEEVARALVDYVADRFNRSAAGLTYDAADELLATAGLDGGLRNRFRSCLESCDFARFVPATAQSERRNELLRDAEGLIEQLEKAS